jgi:hypothetical protein
MTSKPAIEIVIILVLVSVVILSPAVLAGQREERRGGTVIVADRKAPISTSGENIYIAWPSNETGNDEVMFRTSTDAGQTFGDGINLSNTTDAASTRVEIDSDADSVVVTWWETNQTDDTPVMRVSSDNGATFGPVLMLSTNGTVGEASEGEDE